MGRWSGTIVCMLFLFIGQSVFAQGYVTLGVQGTQSGNTSPGPTNGYYTSRKIQVVYTAAELLAGGAAAGNIERLAWDVSALYAGAPLPNYSVKMAHIATTSIPTTSFITGLTTVKTSYSYTPALGFNDIVFDTPFNWNGVDNIVVDICFSAAPYTSPYGQNWNYPGVTNSWRSRQVDGSDLCGSTTADQTYSVKPRVRFYMQVVPPCDGMPSGGTTSTALTRLVCSGSAPGAITVNGASAAAQGGISLQWEESIDNGTNWANATGGTGATTNSYSPPNFAGTNIQYRLKVTCANGGGVAYSDVTSVNNQAAPVTQATALTIVNPAATAFTATWTGGSGGRRYVVVSTSPIVDPVSGSAIPAYTASTTFANTGQQLVYDGTGTSVTVTGLTCNTPYYIKVYEYSRCGAGPYDVYFNTSTGTNAATVTGPLSATLPNVNNFAGYTSDNLGTIATGWYESAIASTDGTVPVMVNPVGNASNWVSSMNLGVQTAKYNLYLGSANAWIISPKIAITNNTRLKFKAAITGYNVGTVSTGMQGTDDKVNVLISTDCGATWTVLHTFQASNTTTLTNVLQNFTFVLGPDYIGDTVQIAFQATDGPLNEAPDYDFHIADILIEEVPSCDVPTLQATSNITKNSATISWNAPTIGVPSGYEYIVSESDDVPVGAGIANTDTNVDLTMLESSTTYYIYVRTVCTDVFSDWSAVGTFTTLCNHGDVLTTVEDSICGEGQAELSVTASEDAIINWYAGATGGVSIGSGETFETPYIYETTDFYVTAGNVSPGTDVTVGNGASTSSSGGYSPFYHGWGGVKTQFIVTAAELQAAGISAGPINSVGFTVTGLGAPSYESFALSIGTTTQSVATNTHVDGLTQVYTNASQTLTLGLNVFTFTTPFAWDGTSNIVVSTCYHNPATPFGGSSATVQYDVTPYVASTYTYADNQSAAAVCAATTGGVGGSGGTGTASARAKMTFNATALCESPRVMVTATVTDAPDIELASEDAEICMGGSTELSVESANAAYTYMWMPGNLAGATQTVSPTATTTYTVIATDEVGGCVESGEITVTVNALPDPVSITPAEADVCFNDVVELNGSMPEMAEYCTPTVVEDGATGDYINNFTFANITNNGSGDAASDYTYYSAMTANVVAGQSYPVTVQGGSATWAQGFRVWIDFNQDGIFSEDESVFNTATAATTQFTGNITIPANAINGTTRMRVGDRYNSVIAATASCSHNGFGEYEDYNVSITGGLEALQYAWTPEEGLFLDEAATMPYTGESVNTVYAFITEDVSYTYTATNGNGCEISSETDITVIITPAPAAAAAQSFCSGATVADLTTTDAEAVTHWYYSAVGGNELAGTTPLLNGTPYFVAQTLNGCEGVARTMVTATVITTPAPEASDDVQTFCNAATLADVEVDGENVMWYAAATGGEALASDMALEEGISLYFASQTVDGCESPMRTAVAVELNVTGAPMVADDAPVFCNSATIADIMVEGDNVMWYDAAEGGNMLAADTALMDGGMYYASQTVNGCESAERTMVDVSINAPEAPTGDDTQEFCFMGTVGDLVAEGAAMWYDAAEGGNMLSADTALVDGMMYYASQVVDGCESIGRFGVTATITVVEADAPENVFACYEYTLPELNNGNYYTDSNGAGEMLTAGTVITETTTLYVYYVGASELGCSDENTFMVVIGNAAAPTGDDTQEFSVEAGEEVTIADIEVATEGIGTITWYASAEDAAAGEDALSADTVLVDGMTYYATWTIGDCTSEEAFAVTIDVVLGRNGFDKGAFTYYPNPVQDVLNMSYTSEISSVEVFNMLGQKVMSIQPNTTEVKLNMASLSDATYIVNVTSGDSVQTIKVVKKQ